MTGRRRGGCWRAAGCSPSPTIPAFARLHRVLGEHIRQRLPDADTRPAPRRPPSAGIPHDLQQTPPRPTSPLLGVTATTLTGRLTDGHHQLADAGLGLIEPVRDRLDFHHRPQPGHRHPARLPSGWPGRTPTTLQYQRDVALALGRVGDLLAGRGEVGAALEHYTRALHIGERLAGADPDNPRISATWRSPWSGWGVCWPGGVRWGAALEHHTRALHIAERLAGADPDNPEYQRDVAVALGRVGDLLAGRGEGARRWSTTPEPCTSASGWPGRTPTTRDYQRDVAVALGQGGGSAGRAG